MLAWADFRLASAKQARDDFYRTWESHASDLRYQQCWVQYVHHREVAVFLATQVAYYSRRLEALNAGKAKRHNKRRRHVEGWGG